MPSMRLPLPRALLLVSALALVGCSDTTATGGGSGKPGDRDDNGGDGDGSDGDNDDDDDSGDGDGDDDIPIKPHTSTPFEADRTGESGLSKADIDALKKGGSSCTSKVVYPYEDTVFPGGLLPPPIMWTGGGDSAYVKVTYDSIKTLSYEYAAKASGELTIPVDDWVEITRRSQNTVMLVTLSVKKGSSVSTCKLNYRVAPGNMVGAVYYNTYNLSDKGGVGAVMRLTLGKKEPQVYQFREGGAAPAGPCRSCHSVSADGSTLASSEHGYPVLGSPTAYYLATSHKTGPNPQPAKLADLADATFGALTPDGKYLLQMGNPQCTSGALAFPRAPNNFMLLTGPTTADLIDTATGKVVDASGLDANNFMWMPQFSPQGDKVVFNHARLVKNQDSTTTTDRRRLAVVTFDQKTRTFGPVTAKLTTEPQGPAPSANYRPDGSIVEFAGNINSGCSPSLSGDAARAAIKAGSCNGKPCYPAWPFFTPDGNGVIYSLISEPDFAVAFPGRETPAKSELWYWDLTTGERVLLANANKGLAEDDPQTSYYPTVLPVQIGGYYWLVFTSTRKWGTRDTNAPAAEALAWDAAFLSTSVSEGYKKRLWVSAIKPRLREGGEFQTDKLEDPSSPPFYLEGQSSTGNTRAFAALNPCKKEKETCTSGLDCCTGYCKVEKGEAEGVCVPEVSCSAQGDKCEANEDCCPPEDNGDPYVCVGGRCGVILL